MSGRHPWPPPGKAQHASDCAVNNEPALPRGACDCGAFRGVQTQLTEERWLAEVSAAKDKPTRDELLLRDIWGALGLLGHLVNETEQNDEVDRLERVIAEILQVAERRVLALADAYLALLEAAKLAEDELIRHQAEAGCADFDRALEAIQAAVSVGSPEARETEE